LTQNDKTNIIVSLNERLREYAKNNKGKHANVGNAIASITNEIGFFLMYAVSGVKIVITNNIITYKIAMVVIAQKDIVFNNLLSDL
jgi:hypothetical protein